VAVVRLFRPFLLVLLLLVMVSGCGYDENKGIFMAPGSYSDLAVVTSSDALAPLAQRFLETFNTTKTFVIKEEPTFLVDVFPTAKWDLAKGYKNSLILVRIGDGGPVEKMVRKSLPSETWDRLKSGAGGVVKLNDPWASYQLAVVVASRDRNNLGSLLTKNRTKIQEIFAESSQERILRRNRFEGLNLPLMEDHWQRFGFFMEVPLDFERIQFLPDGYQGIEMMKKGPSRGLTVTWRPSEDPVGELADIDALAAMRTELGERMHQEEMHPETFLWSAATLGQVECMRLEGAWTSRKFAGGGAFWCYFIPDPDRQRLYCLDLLVYAPGMDKMNFFRHLDAVASTFTTHRPQP
jgi:hypothetical protein